MNPLLKDLTRPRLEDYTILIVDDNPANLSVITDHLEQFGFSVLVSRDGQSGLKRARYANPDIILLDVMMPGIDGFETCHQLKADEKTRDIPVIFMTVLTETENKLRGFRAGAVDYVSKPLEANELIARIATHLRLRDLNERLEDMVRERTSDLYRATEKLKQEIEERKRAEEALRRAERLFAYYVDNIDAYVYIKDRSSCYTFLNKKSEELFNVSRADLQKRKYTDLDFFDEHAAGQIRLSDKRAIENGLHTETEETGRLIVDESGGDEAHARYYFSLKFPLRDHSGNITGLCGFSRDITEQKEALLEKNKLASQLRQAQKMEAIGTLAGGIAHDFNNILGIMIGNTELALDDIPEWYTARRNLEEAQKAGLRARDLVRQLLSFSRKSEHERKPVAITPIVTEAMKLIRSTLPSTIDTRLHISEPVDNILADPTQIHQVIINLCTNAAHAMENGRGRIEVDLSTIDVRQKSSEEYTALDKGRYVRLAIRDDGSGISPQHVERIFDPYFTTKEVGKGTGIGLSVVHGIVENHGGVITVKSQLGRGTVFQVYLPAHETTVQALRETRLSYPRGTECILFVDDEELLLRMAKQILEKLGYHVETCRNPLEAQDLFRVNPDRFDLVISDMTMPHMTGDQLIAEMLKKRPDLPTILCTGFSENINREKADEIGVRKFIEKPFDIRGLAVAVREVLDGAPNPA